MQTLGSRKGIALLTTLLTLVVIAALASLIFVRMLNEMRHSRDDAAITQTLLLARSAANVAAEVLSSQIRDALDSTVARYADSSSPWAFGTGTGSEPSADSVANDLEAVASALQSVVDGQLCNRNFSPSGKGSARIRVHFTDTACGQELPRRTRLGKGYFVQGQPRGSGTSYTQTYALPYVVVAEGSIGPYRRNVVAQGEFRFTVGRASFARYALFTNVHALPDGTNVWFTSRTLFDGPVHTNNHFRFYRTPWFGGEVTSAGCTNPGDERCQGSTFYGARFYGEGYIADTAMAPSPQAPSYTNRWGTHAPEFTQGVDWRSPFIPLPINNQAQRHAARSQGIYVNGDINSLRLYTTKEPDGTLYQRVDVRVCMRGYVRWVWDQNLGNWRRQLVCTQSVTHAYRYSANRVLQHYDRDTDTWKNVVRDGSVVRFNGVIFAEGGIGQLSGPERDDPSDPDTAGPALAPFAQITVAASDTIRITGDLKYTDRPCSSAPHRDGDSNVVPATCNNLGARNVLGVYSQDGDVLIGSDAPRDIHVDGVLMSARGVVQVEGYDSIPEKGSVYLTGGIIEYFYGAFGTFNPSTGRNRTGYGRKFTYDPRMKRGLAPPFFPTTQLDTVLGIQAFSFGQREQVY